MSHDRERTGATKTREIKRWVTELLDLPEDESVMVAELACHEPGCPPVETVISIHSAGKPARVHKLHRSAAEITRADLLPMFRENRTHSGAPVDNDD
jgi:hypothetical protein